MTVNKSSSRNCVFCGRPLVGKKIEEHIFPNWLQKRLGIKKQQLFPTLYTAAGQLDTYRVKTFNGFVSVHICKYCNNGWMHRLEEDTKPLLISLIGGTWSGILSTKQTHLLSFWIFKTALALHTVSIQGMFIPSSHYHAVAERRSIPDRAVIAIALVTGPDEFFWIQNRNWLSLTQDTPAKSMEDSYKITFRLEHFAARVHYWPANDRYVHDYFGNSIQYIWPLGSKTTAWPPMRNDMRTIQEFEESLFIGEKIAGNH